MGKTGSVIHCAKDATEMADPVNSKIIYKNNRIMNEKLVRKLKDTYG